MRTNDPNEMEAPCKCDCGNWFDLDDGWESLTKPGVVVCESCYDKQSEEQNKEEDIQDTRDQIESSEIEIESLQEDICTLKEKIKRLKDKLKSMGVEYP